MVQHFVYSSGYLLLENKLGLQKEEEKIRNNSRKENQTQYPLNPPLLRLKHFYCMLLFIYFSNI